MTALASTSTLPPSQPSPSYVLRGHTAQINVLTFSLDGRTLYSGDVEGWVSVWDLKSFRPRLFWQAHEAGILSIEEWNEGFLTHARDNKIHYFIPPKLPPSINRTPATSVPSPKNPTILQPEWSMDVNAMAFSKMALLRLSDGTALVAVPALTKDDQVDIFHLPSLARVHRSIGSGLFPIGDKTGTIMALTLFLAPSISSSITPNSDVLHLLAGYEDGRVAHFFYQGSKSSTFDPPTRKREESEGWSLSWDEKGHREALMSIALAPDRMSCWSVSADHNLCRYNISDSDSTLKTSNRSRLQKYETAYPGRSTVGIRDDGKLVAVAGWDGETRLYSSKSGEPLAILSYHRSSLHALAFGSSTLISEEDSSDSQEDEEDEEMAVELGTRGKDWLAVGGREETISLWEVYPRTT